MTSFEPRPTILVVDDSDINLDILVHALAEDHRVLVATNGALGLERACREVPDLILLDIEMPGLDGFEVCRRLKEIPGVKRIPVVFLTGVLSEEGEEKGLGLGAVDFITKPFNVGLLRARVKNHLDLKLHQDNLQQLVRDRTQALTLTQEATIASMAILAEFRDNETGAHVQRTKRFVKVLFDGLCACYPEELHQNGLALFLRWDGAPSLPSGDRLACQSLDSDVLFQSAALHDIGKVAIRDSLLLKPGAFTAEEFQEMKRHTLFGAAVIRRTEAILGTNSFLHLAREITEFHHERWDGTGYPHGLRGVEIPLSARLMALADVYDAITSRRPYKQPMSHDAAVKTILEGDGRTMPGHFCPMVLEVFRATHPLFERISVEWHDT
jgi:putative two-component system response regulator